jgi:uncharacterized membrane protein
MAIGSWQLEITRPLWLAALLALPLLIYYYRRSLVRRPRWQQAASLGLRVTLILLVIAALCGLELNGVSHEPFVVVAVDCSASIPAEYRQIGFLETTSSLSEDRSGVLHFSAKPSYGYFGPDPSGTNIAAAIAAARAEIPAEYVPRIVLLSDGNETEGDALAAAKIVGVPIFTVPLPGQPEKEVYVAAIEAPAKVREGEPFSIEVVVRSTREANGTLRLLCDAKEAARQQKKVAAGDNRFRLQHAIVGQPKATLTAVIEDFPDTIAENNRASVIVFTAPRPCVLLADSQPSLAEPLAKALRGSHIDVKVCSPESLPEKPDGLREYDLLMLSNVPAAALSAERMEAVRKYVHDLGGGLIAVGGEQSFTPGGYRHTVLEEALPVVSEARKERPKPSLAMVLVLDRSGSMQGESIALAKQAARQAVEILGPRDKVGVLAFEDAARWVSPIRPCSDKRPVLEAIDTIAAEGGTNMYPALERAYLALNETFADLKHVILMTDGLSNPGDFAALARQIAASGITVSTVGIGPEAVQPLLQDIAETGRGHYYFCENAKAVPRIFTLETTIAGKIGITEEPFTAKMARPAEVFANIDLERAPTLLGYVETQPKPACEVVLTSKEGDPLLAWWRCGAGRSAAFTSDAQSRWAAAWLRWDGFGPFWTQLARHVMRPGPSSGLARGGSTPDYPAELRVRPTNVALLKSIAAASGGRFAAEPADVVAPSAQTVPRTIILWPYLLTLAMLAFAADFGLQSARAKREVQPYAG